MKIIFCSCFSGQTGTTSNLAAITAYLAIQSSNTLFLMQSQFGQNYLDEALQIQEAVETNEQPNGMDTLFRMIKSEPVTKEMIDSCSVNLYRNRFYLLPRTIQQDASMYESVITPLLVYCMNAVNLYYETVFLDAGKVTEWSANSLLDSADLIVVDLSQNEHALNQCFSQGFGNRKNLFYLVGNYDPVSKYNLAHIRQTYKISASRIGVIPYNTMFRDAYSDGSLIKFISQITGSTRDEMNYYFVTEVEKTAQKLMSLNSAAKAHHKKHEQGDRRRI